MTKPLQFYNLFNRLYFNYLIECRSNLTNNNDLVFILNYNYDILELLYRNPQGLSARCIVYYIYNMHNSLFNPISFDDVKVSVLDYLVKSSKRKSSPIERVDRSMYRLSEQYREEQNMMFVFTDDVVEETKHCISMSKSPGLFDDTY